MTKHQKHTKLPLRTMGTFAPNEIAILGSTCGTITDFVNNLASFLKPLSLTYVDASHHALTEKPNINHHTFNANQTINLPIIHFFKTVIFALSMEIITKEPIKLLLLTRKKKHHLRKELIN